MHPSIVAWMPFNESWGVPDLPDSPTQRHYVQALYHLTKTFDPTRPVIGNDGWESVATDIIGIHDYDHDAARIGHRYGADSMLPRLLKRERPGGRMLMLNSSPGDDQPVMLTEFGGIAYHRDDGAAWGATRESIRRKPFVRPTPGSWKRFVASVSWPVFATRSSPTRIKKPMACCTPIGRRIFRSPKFAPPPGAIKSATNQSNGNGANV